MTSIELRQVTVAGDRGGPPLLDNISLTVLSGATLAITGPPGAGKSLLMRVVVGLQEQTSGEILLDDIVVDKLGPRERDLSMVFDDFALHPQFDVFDNLAFSSTLRRRYDKAALSERVDEVAGFLALSDLVDLRPDDLDPAQQQRVALGRCLVRDAVAYLLDDPFAAQPDRIRTHVRSVTRQWQAERGRTSIIATSDVAEALTLADRVAVMHQGFIHQVGTPRELYDAPQDMFVAGFVGAPPMNLIPARPVGQQLVTPLATIYLDEQLQSRIGDRDLVVVGIRPEDCHELSNAPAVDSDRVEFTTSVDDVEWRGGTQLAYLGFEIEPEIEERLEEVEDLLDFDLFQSFLVAQIPGAVPLEPGMPIRVVAPRNKVMVFDLETGENLTLPRA